MSTKPKLRKELQLRRSLTSEVVRNTFSQTIIGRLIQTVEWREINRVHCYVPIAARSEVDTWPLLHYLWQHWPNIEIVVPGPLRAGRPTTYKIDKNTTWRETSTAPYPLGIELMFEETVDLIIVPCLGFDRECYRLGYGGGYYDRLLLAHSTVKNIGIAFWAGYVTDGLPHEPHDVALQNIITEEIVL